jgi:hypothetical protein
MSIAEFSPVLRARIIEIYSDKSNKVDLASFKKVTRKELFKKAPDTKDIRSKFQSKDYHTSSLTLEGFTALNKKLVDKLEGDKTKEVVANLLNNSNFFNTFVGYIEQTETLQEYGSGDFRLKKVPEKKLRDYFIQFISESIPGLPATTLQVIKDNVESGHLAGIFFLKAKVALGIQSKFSESVTATYRDFTISLPGLDDGPAIRALDSVLKALLDADFLTSNLVTESQVFIDAVKSVLGNNPSLITELQFKEDNKKAGDLLQQSGRQLNNLIKAVSASEESAAEAAIANLIISLKPVVQEILVKAEELRAPLSEQGLYDPIVKNAKFLAEELINTPGSITIKDGIGKHIAQVAKTGKSTTSQKVKIKPKPIKQQHKELLDISGPVKEFKKAAEKIKKTLNQVKTAANIRVVASKIKAKETSLTFLQNLLNSNLVQTVKQNMGAGSRRDVLNLRSGRFAESVRVERLTQGRQGMITAYYDYMRNPYATFSQGGKQELPRSRDPKLLIAKSIRQIAAQAKITRLRAVLV